MNNIGMIFDFDGTLADTLNFCIWSFQAAYEEVTGIKISEPEVTSYFGISEVGIAQALVPEQADKFLNAYFKTYRDYLDNEGTLFNGVMDILNILQNKKIKISMVTGKGAQAADLTLDKFEIKHYFEHVETGSTQNSIKTQCIEKIVKSWDLNKENIYYIGDQPSDIVESKLAGVRPIAVSWAQTSDHDLLKQHEPYLLFSDIKDFRSWIVNL